MKKKFYTYDNVHSAAHKIALQMYKDNWRPDYIVGITRGGLPLALALSHILDCRMETLKVKLRDNKDGEDCESNCWMSEDAFGYINQEDRTSEYQRSDVYNKKNILIVDDINDTGATFNWIKKDWEAGCLPGHEGWQDVWRENVRFATMCEKTHTKFDGVDYVWEEIDTSEKDTWLVFPWEYD